MNFIADNWMWIALAGAAYWYFFMRQPAPVAQVATAPSATPPVVPATTSAFPVTLSDFAAFPMGTFAKY